MTQEEIIEYNELCAKFLELKLTLDNLYEWNNLLFDKDELLFHSDWNWIMEVCTKLGMEFVSTNKEQLIQQIYDKLRNMETN